MYQRLHKMVIAASILLVAYNSLAQNNASMTNQNVFLGSQTGSQNTGASNVFVGYQSGKSNTSAGSNTFLGYQAGTANSTGTANFMGGAQAGYSNTSGSYNVYVGPQAGVNTTTGSYNMFMGNVAGGLNIAGSYNMAIGDGAGFNNNANGNTYIGVHAGFDNKTGNNNVFIGYQANVGGANANSLSNAIAIGANAMVTASNALVLGNGVNVGIGNSAPQNKLEISQGTAGNSGLRFTNLTSGNIPSVSTNQFLTVNANGDVVLALVGGNRGFRTAAGLDSTNLWSSDGQNLRNANAGGVVIGPGITSTPAGYRLYVAEGVLTEKVKVAVKTTQDWSDKVFDTGYDLKKLGQVEAYIKANKHLPGVPSAEEVVKQGLDVAKMDATLLEKIEELTLYSIQQQKEIEQLKQLVKQLMEKK